MSNWGKGHENNSIGWGQGGVNNSIGWGSVYDRSASGQTLLNPIPSDDFIIEVNTALAGVSASNQFQFTGAIGEYDVKAYQNGSLVASFNDLINEETITLPSQGIYELRVIIKEAGFDKMEFNDGGDRLKLLKILNWGSYGVNEPNQSNAFRGCENNTEIAGNGAWFDVVTNGGSMFRDNSLTSLPSDMHFPLMTLATSMFFNNNLISLPLGMNLPLLTLAVSMFRNNNLTSLPVGMKLPLLENGNRMLEGNTINTERYSQLLIDLEANNNNNNVGFHGGNSKYNSQGEIARNALIARGWTIIDGGFEN